MASSLPAVGSGSLSLTAGSLSLDSCRSDQIPASGPPAVSCGSLSTASQAQFPVESSASTKPGPGNPECLIPPCAAIVCLYASSRENPMLFEVFKIDGKLVAEQLKADLKREIQIVVFACRTLKTPIRTYRADMERLCIDLTYENHARTKAQIQGKLLTYTLSLSKDEAATFETRPEIAYLCHLNETLQDATQVRQTKLMHSALLDIVEKLLDQEVPDFEKAEILANLIPYEEQKIWALRSIVKKHLDQAAPDFEEAERIVNLISCDLWKTNALRGIIMKLVEQVVPDFTKAKRIANLIPRALVKRQCLGHINRNEKKSRKSKLVE